MKKRIGSFFRKENSGSAIVIVIVAMAFVGILASTIMWMSLINFRMKMTDRKIKENFYSAEVVFDQMLVGLQNLSSDAADQSYSFIMQNYSNFSEQKREAEFQKEYLKAVAQAISKSSTETDLYDLEKLMLYVDAGLNVGIVNPSSTNSWIGARSQDITAMGSDDENKSRYGEIVAPQGEDYLILKGLHLEYYDHAGFLTIIDTDLMIGSPDAGFTQTGRIASAFDYAIIADRSLENEIVSGTNTIDGNVYVGEKGILANHKFVFQNADYVISKGDVEIHKNGSLQVGSGENDVPAFWAKGLVVDKDVVSGSNVSLRAHSYIKDDLTVNGNSATVTLTNSYYGYGDSESEVSESSAIIINGINNTLNMSGVKQLLLAGHAFVNVKAKSIPDPSSAGERTVNVPMGESIAIKGGQIAYLVPDECVGVLYGQSVYQKNPMTGDEYATLLEYRANPEYAPYFKEVDVNKQLEIYGGKSLASYGIDEVNGIEKVFIPANGETQVYYYLKFPSTEDAEYFFKDYYKLHKEKIDRYTGLYASGGIRSNSGYTRLTMAGDYLTASAKGAQGNTVTYHSSSDSKSKVEDLEDEVKEYHNTFNGLTTALTSNYLTLSVEEKARKDVFENLIKEDALEAYVGSGTKTFLAEDGSGVKAILTGESSYTYDGDPNVVLIIATGDVVLSDPFEGVIFADGTVTMKAGATVKSAKNADKMSHLVRVLQSKHSEADTTKPLDFIRNVEDYVLAGTALVKDEDGYHRNWVDFEDIVSYQNWNKH